MENTRIIELLELAKDRLINCSENYGICRAITNSYYHENDEDYSENEYESIMEYVKSNKPTPYNQYKLYTINEFWIDDEFWWMPIHSYPETKYIRINYLNELIDNLK